jgi:hypothetical protein
MKNRFSFPAALLLCAVLVAGCGASKPPPPKSLCGVKVKASAITPLLPEGEQVTEKREKRPTARNHCSVSIDGAHYFDVEHDLDSDGYAMSPSFVRKQPRTFQGKLGTTSLQAAATATCPGRHQSVYAAISLDVAKDDVYSDNRDDLEKFLNAYVPGLEEHYGCEG